MWNLNSSLIIIISIVLSTFFNTKVILPRLKYFLTIMLVALCIVTTDFLTLIDKQISVIIVEFLLGLFLVCVVLYLEKDNAMSLNRRAKKRTLIPYLITTILYSLLYLFFVYYEPNKNLFYYHYVKKYGPIVFYYIQCIWIFVEIFFTKNKKTAISLCLIVLLLTISSSFFYNENILGTGVSLSMLFLFNGIENNTDYYDINSVNYNSNIFKLAYSNKKIRSKKILVFIKINSKDVNKKIVMNKILNKNFFKFKKNVFGCFMNFEKFMTLLSKKNELINFKIKNNIVNYDYQIFYVKNDFFNKLSKDITNLIDYIASNNKNFTDSYEITEDDLEEIIKNKKILNIVNDAIKNDGFEIFYQPIYSTKDKNFASAEALLRIKDTKDLGYISPEIFIPIAENYGLAEDIGNIVFDKVCDFFVRENLEQYGIKYIELNVSGLHIVKDNVVNDFTRIIQKYNLNPEKINIEVTETAQISNQKKMNENLKMLRNLGFKFSMDDFGSGYSNMTNIVENNYELIKIDKSIVWSALKENNSLEDSSILLDTCINLGHKLKRKIVAEGVEDENMVKYLEEQGVEYLQGYHFSKPINEGLFINFLKENCRL